MTANQVARNPVTVGVIGAGVISDTYLQNLTSFPDIRVAAIGDRFPAAAQTRAAQFGIPSAGDVETVLAHPDVELVVNLTIPAAHAQVASAALAAESTSGTRSPWPSTWGTRGLFSTPRTQPVSASAAPLTRFSGQDCRPPVA